jgi:hypothetical protein
MVRTHVLADLKHPERRLAKHVRFDRLKRV